VLFLFFGSKNNLLKSVWVVTIPKEGVTKFGYRLEKKVGGMIEYAREPTNLATG
jgi:hypothetical protein